MSGSLLDKLPVQPTSFVGRHAELAAVTELLHLRRLVTIAGAAGLGKTRLAIEVAARVQPEAEVWFLPLAEGAGPDSDGLVAALMGRPALLVMDGCDRWRPGSKELVRALLAACPGLRVLTTAVEPLGLTEETVYQLGPMAVPGPEASFEALATSEAVRLFWARAMLVRPDFRLTPENAAQVAALCRRLEGIPLAIELAASSAWAGAPGALLEELQLRMGSRDGNRRTLEAALEWEHDQLEEPDRVLFRRLAVFAGGLETSAALAVCAGPGLPAEEIAGRLATLARRSLLMADGPRFRMLEPVRRFAARWLSASGEEKSVRDRHAAYFAELAGRGAGTEGRAFVWLDWMEAEHHNLLAALRWWRGRDRRRWIELVLALAWFWVAHGHLGEGRTWLERLLADGELEPAQRGAALYGLARVLCWQGDYESSVRAAERALELQRTLGMEREAGWTLSLLGSVRGYAGQLQRGSADLEWLAAHADGELRVDALVWLGELRLLEQKLEAARRILDRALEEARREPGDLAWHTMAALVFLSAAAHLEGDPVGGGRLAGRALTIGYPFQNPYSVAACLDLIGGTALAQGQPLRALTLAAAADRIRTAAGAPLLPGWRQLRESLLVEPARAAAGPEAETAWRQGAAMGLEEAVAAGLAVVRQEPAPAPPLTRREADVADLVARGLTNREIARRLGIAERTVESHLDSIRSKLGVRSRTQVAVWMVGQGRAAQPDRE